MSVAKAGQVLVKRLYERAAEAVVGNSSDQQLGVVVLVVIVKAIMLAYLMLY